MSNPLAVANVVAWHHSEQGNPASFEANIAQRIKHHSPSGMGVGYGGSGAADFALNILDYRLKSAGYRGKTFAAFNKAPCYTEICGLHQSFKWTFLAIAPDESFIEWEIIDAWMYATSFDKPIGAHLKERVSSLFHSVFTRFYDEQALDERIAADDETARRNLIFFKTLREIRRAKTVEDNFDSAFADIATAFIIRFEIWRAQR